MEAPFVVPPEKYSRPTKAHPSQDGAAKPRIHPLDRRVAETARLFPALRHVTATSTAGEKHAMKYRGLAPPIRVLLTFVVCAAGLLATHPALASNSGCRTDPEVVLSNGTTLNLTANIGASYANVQ